MSIASRIEAIEQHLTDDYNVLEVAGADLTNVDKNILNLKTTWQERLLYFMNNGTDVVWNNWDKVTGEGTSISLNNTLEGKMKIVLKGNTSQEGTPTPETPQDIHVVSGDNSIDVVGKNLFTIKNYSKSGYNVKIDNPLKGQSAGTYTISCENLIPIEDGRGCAVMFLNENNQRVGNYFVGYDFGNVVYSNTKNLTQEELDAPYMRLDFTNNNATQEGINRAKIMINKGNKTTYTPYESASYPINLPVENLFNFSNTTISTLGTIGTTTVQDDKVIFTANGSTYGIQFDIKNLVEKNTTYTISNLMSSTQTLTGNGNGWRYYDGSSYTALGGYQTQFTFTTGTGTTHTLYYYVGTPLQYNGTLTLDKIQLEKGTKANSYTPYGTTPIELCKIGTYQDSIVKDNGKWYVHKEIGKDTITSVVSVGTTTSGLKYAMVKDNHLTEPYGEALCSKYAFNASPTNRYNTIKIINGGIYIYDERFTDTTTALSCINGLDYYFQLKTPTYTEITDSTLLSQLNALAKSYASQTNISQENNDLASILNATALKEME